MQAVTSDRIRESSLMGNSEKRGREKKGPDTLNLNNVSGPFQLGPFQLWAQDILSRSSAAFSCSSVGQRRGLLRRSASCDCHHCNVSVAVSASER